MENTIVIILSIFLIPPLIKGIAFTIGQEIVETIEHKKAIKAIRDQYNTHPGQNKNVDAYRKLFKDGNITSLKVC